MRSVAQKHLIEFPFDGQDYRARYTVTDGSVEDVREFAVETEDGWMALEASDQLYTEAVSAIQIVLDSARDYLRTGF